MQKVRHFQVKVHKIIRSFVTLLETNFAKLGTPFPTKKM